MKRTPWILAATLLAAAFGLGAVVAPDNLPLALEAQRRLVAENPDDSAAWNDLGNLLTLGGDLDAAEDAYERAVDLAPDRAAYHFNYALLLQQRDKLRAARKHYRRVIDITPGNAWAWYQLGAIAEAQGREAAAVARYARALELEPSLGFHDVNPHVIESELIGEAMLRGYRRGGAEPQAPRVYSEPARITSLLLPSLPAPGEPEAEPDDAMERQAVQREMRGPTGQVPPPPERAPAASTAGPATAGAPTAGSGSSGGSIVPRRVLTDDDLDSTRPTNQLSTPGAGQRGGYQPPNRRQQPQPSVRYVPTPVPVPDTAPPAPRGRQTPPPAGGGQELVPPQYRPGLPSTGRLEMVLEEGPTSARG